MRYAKKAKKNDQKVRKLLFINRIKNFKKQCVFDFKEEEEEEEIIKPPINNYAQKSFEDHVSKIIKERRMAQMLYSTSPAAFRCVRCFIKISSESTIKRDLNQTLILDLPSY